MQVTYIPLVGVFFIHHTICTNSFIGAVLYTMLANKRKEYYSIGALAAAALLLEGALTRFLAVAQFYHFAFLVVSLALLGFGASGSLLSLFPRWYSGNGASAKRDHLGRLLTVSGVGFAASIGLLFFTVNLLPFDSYNITCRRSQVML